MPRSRELHCVSYFGDSSDCLPLLFTDVLLSVEARKQSFIITCTGRVYRDQDFTVFQCCFLGNGFLSVLD